MAKHSSIPKGTRDFLPQESLRRAYIFSTIRSVFRLYGYQPIETPAMENLSTLLGKYGEEGDKLLFRILNSGNFLSGVPADALHQGEATALASKICEKGLRYDLTVPFARFVVQHLNEITFPFKRYQIQPVWRADRPQKGRYREFFQCDADVIGSDSLLNEAEMVQIIDDVFSSLGIRVRIILNNRKILAGIAEVLGIAGKLIPFTIAIDKIEKAGIDSVHTELLALGVPETALERLTGVLNPASQGVQVPSVIEQMIADSEIGRKGIIEMTEILKYLSALPLKSEVVINPSLARGLNYYTGTIIEVKAADVQIGSICGGGRYDDLTRIFGLPGVSGVGVSFGAERIYDVLAELKAFPAAMEGSTKVLFINFGRAEAMRCLALMQQLRAKGISTELYPDNAKIKKQFSYADARQIPLVAIIGEEELSSGKVILKNMVSGEQVVAEQAQLADLIV